MFDAAPFDEWSEEVAEFWTFGGESSTGTWILTILGFAVMLIAFWGFVVLEKQKLTAQADRLRATGALERPQTPGPGPTVTDTGM
jgi:hypothetical protein